MSRRPHRPVADARLLALLALLAWPAARAQALLDPTRPPPEARLAAPGADAGPVASAGPQLQSILIGARGREVAVIDGQTLRRGDKLNGAVLVHIGRNQVVLQHGRERRVLTLFPDAAAEAKAAAHQR